MYFVSLLYREFWRWKHDIEIADAAQEFCESQIKELCAKESEFRGVNLDHQIKNRFNRYNLFAYNDEDSREEQVENEFNLVHLLLDHLSLQQIRVCPENSCTFDGSVRQTALFKSLLDLHLAVGNQFTFCLKGILT